MSHITSLRSTRKNRGLYLSKALFGLLLGTLTWPMALHAQGTKELEGTWDVTVTLKNCVSGTAIRSFPRMITFQRGGSLTEWASSGTDTAPVSRSVGLGAWEYLGSQEFSYDLKFIRMNQFGGSDGFIQELLTLKVDTSGSGYTADGMAYITLSNGFVVGPLCANEKGSRLF